MNGKQKMRRRRRFAMLVGMPGVILGACASILFVGGPASKAAAIRADLETLLSSRSPGERQAGALAMSKPARPQAATERVLSPVRYRRPVTPPGAAAPAGVAPLVDGAPEDAVAAVPAGAPTAVDAAPDLGGLGGPGAFAPGAIFAPSAGASPGGGASGGSTTPLTAVTTPPTGVTAPPAADIVSAVPEPATWVSLIVGFLLMGLALRRSGRAASDGRPAVYRGATE